MQRAWVQHQMLKLDGTLHMQQLGGALRQRLHRLAVKLHETAAVGTICPDSVSGPWDCGWLNSGPAAEAQAARFAPRRPTLVVAWGLQQPVLETFQAALAQGQQRFTHPVRLWVLDLPALA